MKQRTVVAVECGLYPKVFPKVIWHSHVATPPRQRMDSHTACASCAMLTADESSHSAASTLHPHHTDGHTTTECTMLAQHRVIKIHQIRIWPTHTAEKSSNTSYHPSATKVICEELRSHPSCKE